MTMPNTIVVCRFQPLLFIESTLEAASLLLHRSARLTSGLLLLPSSLSLLTLLRLSALYLCQVGWDKISPLIHNGNRVEYIPRLQDGILVIALLVLGAMASSSTSRASRD